MKPLFLSLFLAIAAYGQQTSVAVLPSDGTVLNSDELEALTDEMRETALKVLPTNTFVLLKQDVVVKRLGGAENFIKECKESTCIVDLGKKAQVDYVAQASVSKLGNIIRLKVELYNVRTEGLVGMFIDEAGNIRDLLAIVKKRAPEVFSKIFGASGSSRTPSIAGGISGVQKTAAYEADGEKLHLVNLNTEPSSAALSFDGVPSCPKTPCKVELRDGSVRIIAALEQYETTDTTVSIKQNNQNIAITLKPNFGILDIKPAYSDGIGKDRQWSLSINDKSYSLGEVRLLPNKYAVRLNHECYENIGFDVGINKGKREVFDMASNITLKKGGLALSAERNGEPVSEPVFVNGKQVGETPFNGSVPLCAKVEVGGGKEVVDVKLKHNEKIKHTHSIYVDKNSFTDKRDGKKYRTVVIGNQTWMAENLNYEIGFFERFFGNSVSKCYGEDGKVNYSKTLSVAEIQANCAKYGRLYNWSAAMKACPKGWHLPSYGEWDVLMEAVGGTHKAGKYLKSVSGWNAHDVYGELLKDVSGNGTDAYGFSALPGGMYNMASYQEIGTDGYWWSSNLQSTGIRIPYYQKMDHGDNAGLSASYNEISLLSVRCVQD